MTATSARLFRIQAHATAAAGELVGLALVNGPNPMLEHSAVLLTLGCKGAAQPTSPCRSDPLPIALCRPRVVYGFGGQEQVPPDCGSVTPVRVQRRVLVGRFPGGKGPAGRSHNAGIPRPA